MTTRRWTIAVLLAAVGGLILWDIIVATNRTDGDTISEIVLAVSYSWYTLPLALGVVCGHLIWPAKKKLLRSSEATLWVLIFVGTVALMLDALLAVSVFPLWPFLVGVGVGRVVWPQRLR